MHEFDVIEKGGENEKRRAEQSDVEREFETINERQWRQCDTKTQDVEQIDTFDAEHDKGERGAEQREPGDAKTHEKRHCKRDNVGRRIFVHCVDAIVRNSQQGRRLVQPTHGVVAPQLVNERKKKRTEKKKRRQIEQSEFFHDVNRMCQQEVKV